MPTRNPTLTGAAGEHYVAFRLSQMGFPVALTRGGSPTVDLMVGDLMGNAAVSLQVKAASGALRERKRKPENSFWEWSVGPKALTLRGKSIFYVFVDLKWAIDSRLDPPDVFIVPSQVVADQFPDPTWRMFMFRIKAIEAELYREKWEFITNCISSPPIATDVSCGPLSDQ